MRAFRLSLTFIILRPVKEGQRWLDHILLIKSAIRQQDFSNAIYAPICHVNNYSARYMKFYGFDTRSRTSAQAVVKSILWDLSVLFHAFYLALKSLIFTKDRSVAQDPQNERFCSTEG